MTETSDYNFTVEEKTASREKPTTYLHVTETTTDSTFVFVGKGDGYSPSVQKDGSKKLDILNAACHYLEDRYNIVKSSTTPSGLEYWRKLD